MAKVIKISALEALIKHRLRSHLRNLGFRKTRDGLLLLPGDSKESLRLLHRAQRLERLNKEQAFINSEWPKLRGYFADGSEVRPSSINPRLEQIQADTWQSKLFRLASLTWSVPVSQGYGRRLRFLVWDDDNNKLIGLIALTDPVFNLKVRDELIGWNAEERRQNLVNVLDAYVLGALPPYNILLGGKLIACLVKTKEVRDTFYEKYNESRGVISQRKKHPFLVLVMTSSALGRSSVYNRLVLDGQRFFEPLGYTSGWGHFHIPQSLFNLMREYLTTKKHEYAKNNRFGDGPNWRLRAVRHSLTLLGLNPDLLRHGVVRQVFACKLAKNALKVLSSKDRKPNYNGLLSVAEVSGLAKSRWLEPRSVRRPEYRLWNRDQIFDLLFPLRSLTKPYLGELGVSKEATYVSR